LNHDLMQKFIPSLSLKGTVTKPKSSSFSSSAQVVIPHLLSAALQDGAYQHGQAYHSTHEDRRDAAWGIQQPGARHEILSDLFPDLGESSYADWDFQQSDVLLTFMNQRMLAAPEETRHIWKLDGPLKTAPHDETPSWPGCTWHTSAIYLRSGTSSITHPLRRSSTS
jgi:hypothetical protein